MVVSRMNKPKVVAAICLGLYVFVFGMGAMPKQESAPPQPFYADFYSGTITVQEKWPMSGIKMFACVLDCDRFKTDKIDIQMDAGLYEGLKIDPTDKRLLYQEVTFYLDNGFGVVKANETSLMEGAFIRKVVDLTFDGSAPVLVPVPEKVSKPEEIETKVDDASKVVVPPALPNVGGVYGVYLISLLGVLGLSLLVGGIGIALWGQRFKYSSD